MRLRAGLLALLFAVVGLAVPAQAAEPELAVVWPSITTFNPDTTSYTFTVADTGAGSLTASWGDTSQPIGQSGEQTMTFPQDGDGSILIYRCIDQTGCRYTGISSPSLSVHRSLSAWIEKPSGTLPAGGSVSVLTMPDLPGVEVAWQLTPVRAGGEASAGGFTASSDSSGHLDPPVVVPLGTPDGDYTLTVTLDAEVEGYGPLRGSHSASVSLDSTAPTTTLSVDRATIYFVQDGYQDTQVVHFSSSERGSSVLNVIDDSGKVLRRIGNYSQRADVVKTVEWNGRVWEGMHIIDGDYRLQLLVTDRAGFTSTQELPIELRREELATATFHRTVTAKGSLTSKHVGRCSTLRSPSPRGWRGSLGLYSQTRCTARSGSAVQTYHGMYVPKAVLHRYDRVQVTVTGGGATGKRHKPAYLVLGYIRTGGAFASRRQFGPALGQHRGWRSEAQPLVFDKTTRPYVIWTTGLSAGSRYDIKSFTVDLSYTVLR